MDEEKTWIEQPLQRPATPQEEPPLPPMPPPPPPPGSGGGRNWTVIGFLAGIGLLVICAVIAFGAWRLWQSGALPFGPGASPTADSAALTLTALAGEVDEVLQATDTPVLEPTQPPPTEAPPTDTEAPTDTPTETPIPTPSVPIFSAGQALFCRAGPSTIYQETRTMNAGDAAEILGRSVSPVDGVSIWWQVEINGRRCFVSSGLGTVEGDTSALPDIPAPPTPTPTPTLTPTPTPTATPTP